MSFSEDLQKERERILRLVDQARTSWASAMRGHAMAPPDAGFADRLQALADAAAIEHVAWEQAHAAGFKWRPIPGAKSTPPPYELRPNTGRRGPEDLWRAFDKAVAGLNAAIEGSSAATVADAFGQFADIAADLAQAVREEDELLHRAHDRSRTRPIQAA